MPSHKRFHHRQFADVKALIAHKGSQRISVCIPTLNEAATIGAIVSTIRKDLGQFIDEILVIDSGSTDSTVDVAQAAGAQVVLATEILPDQASYIGKGENLWKALHVASGDLICFVDGDISDFHSGFITGLIGPMLEDSEISYVKAYYDRPLSHGVSFHSTGGGRVSEILVRPLISLFYPELNFMVQPLSGEYAGRRSLFESLSFPIGYGVEIAHLIDLATSNRIPQIAQTDLVKRSHRNRDDIELGSMAFAILQVVLRRLERDKKISIPSALPDLYQFWSATDEFAEIKSKMIPEPERPPLR